MNEVRWPQNQEAERALLGSLILDNRLLDTVHELAPAEAVAEAAEAFRLGLAHRAQGEALFFNPVHGTIFGAIVALGQAGRAFDLTVLAAALQERGFLEMVGGASYLAGLEDDIFSMGQVGEYVRIIAEHWQRRRMIRAASEIEREALDTALPVGELVEGAERRVFELAQGREKRDFVSARAAIGAHVETLRERGRGAVAAGGLRTGFGELDRMTGGLAPGLLLLAARTSQGKTALALNLATHAALKEGVPVAIFSLEMSTEEIFNRMLASEAQVHLNAIKHGRMSREEWRAVEEARERIAAAELHIDDTSSLSVMEIRARSRRLASRVGGRLGLVVVDYLQLVRADGGRRERSREQDVAEVSRSLKALSGGRELGAPILALSQLSREADKRAGGGQKGAARDDMPRLSDLRESGSLEQDADLVMFVKRRIVMGRDGQVTDPSDGKIRIAKQRNGVIGDVDMVFSGRTQTFRERVFERSANVNGWERD